MEEFNRVILIDKPSSISSFGVVAKVRWKLTEEKFAKLVARDPNISRKSAHIKVGHCGTLDPFATGLLILVSGRETKNAAKFAKLDKIYEAEIILGATSTTGDPEGEIREIHENIIQEIPSRETIAKLLTQKFTGAITQTPPIYSAIKINGERAYKLARSGEKPEMPSRTVTIFRIEILDYIWPMLKIRAHVSSGTYIRSLATDIGRELGCGAYTKNLRRTKVANYDVKDAQKLDDFLA